MRHMAQRVIYSALTNKICMSSIEANLVNLSQEDLAANLQGKLSIQQKHYLQQQYYLALLGVLSNLLIWTGFILAILNQLYLLIVPLLFWQWVARHTWQHWRAIRQDRQTGEVGYWDGQIYYQMNFSPGLIRFAQYQIQADEREFSVSQNIFFQLQNLGNYRIFFATNSEIFLGAMPLSTAQIEESAPPSDFLEQFNPRELEILQLIADGLSNKEIAQQLHLSINTIKMYNSALYQKLGVRRRTEAVAEAKKLNLI